MNTEVYEVKRFLQSYYHYSSIIIIIVAVVIIIIIIIIIKQFTDKFLTS